VKKKYVLLLNENGICETKAINYIDNNNPNEIEITKEQYNQINEFPLKLTFDKNGKVIEWEKTELPQLEKTTAPLVIPTLEERLLAIEKALLEVL